MAKMSGVFFVFFFLFNVFFPFQSAVKPKLITKLRAVENESAVSSCGVTAGVYLYAFILSRKVGTSEAWGGAAVTAMTAHPVNNHVILISKVIMRC